MYVWVDALTNYLTGVGFPDTVVGVVPSVLACRPAHDRQGHHPVPHRVLARVSDVGRNRVAAQGFRARVRAQPRREDEQVGGQRRRPGEPRRHVRRRPGALLLPARGAVRAGRQLQRGRDHQPHQRRPRQRVGQPGAAVAVDGRQEPRRDRPRARRIHRRRPRDAGPRRRRAASTRCARTSRCPRCTSRSRPSGRCSARPTGTSRRRSRGCCASRSPTPISSGSARCSTRRWRWCASPRCCRSR